jgi:hypothetical protein
VFQGELASAFMTSFMILFMALVCVQQNWNPRRPASRYSFSAIKDRVETKLRQKKNNPQVRD